MADRVRVAEYEPAATAADIYAEADALVLLSVYEGYGLPPLAAQAAGLPVLCSDIPVFREVLGDGALFVGRDDPDAVAEGLRRIGRASQVRCGGEGRGVLPGAVPARRAAAAPRQSCVRRDLARMRI